MEVFLLHHVHEFDDGHEDVKLIGVFSSREEAEAALAGVRDQPGFRDLPTGFEMSSHQLDRASWLEDADDLHRTALPWLFRRVDGPQITDFLEPYVSKQTLSRRLVLHSGGEN
jgi:hypothetical protein